MTPIADEFTRDELKNVVENISANGGTNLAAGLFDGLDQQYYVTDAANSSTIKRVMLFTDGLPTEGINSYITYFV